LNEILNEKNIKIKIYSMNRRLLKIVFIVQMIITILTWGNANGQVSIVNAHLNTLNVTPASVCEVSIMNNQGSVQVIIEAQVLNSANEPLLDVQSLPFYLSQGMNVLSSGNIPINTTQYGVSAQASYIQTAHSLPSGTFKYCCTVQVLSTEGGDEYCEDVESELSSNMYLVFPNDKDTIETKNPVLIWTHSEPFNIVATGEYFRMIVVELTNDQNAEDGITINNPIYMKNSLTTHALLYPSDAEELENGKRYGWQVQRVTNGIITDKTEAWEYTMKPATAISENKYAVLKKTLDAGFYTAENGKLFFRFNEEYISGKVSCTIYNSAREKILPVAINEDKSITTIAFKKSGYNCYEINLNDLNNVNSGFYTLEVKNEKGEVFLLKFYVE
jgi:antitoxin component of MazEF toxin-antitoxin module